MMKSSRAFIGIAVLLTALFAGCAHRGPILVDVSYTAPRQASEEVPKVLVGVSPFRDERGKTESVVGQRFNSLNDKVNDLVVQGTVSEKVTTALKNALGARNISVKEDPEWDLTESRIPVNEADLVISGQIKTLWVESVSSLAKTKVTAKVELRVVAADVLQKKIIRALNLNSTIERQSVAYSNSLVEGTIAEALSTAINQIFKDDELKKRLK